MLLRTALITKLQPRVDCPLQSCCPGHRTEGAFLARVHAHSIALKQPVANVCTWPIAGAAVIEIDGTLLTVKLLVPMSGMDQAVPEVD